jgi:acid phosphatase family membrane protein YuiD
MKILDQLLTNTILMAALISWMSSQLIKTALTLFSTKRFDVERIFGAGGMPSAHSAMVCSLAMGIANKCTVASPEFAFAVAFAGVVMYDAMGVRRAAGEQAKVINKMVDAFEKNEGSDISDKELKEYLGHTPVEVLAGALLGIIVWMIIL